MEREFLPFELAVKLKELRFDEACIYYFNKSENNQLWQDIGSGYYRNSVVSKGNLLWGETYDNGNASAPLFQQAFDWFREKYELNNIIDSDSFNKNRWQYKINSIDKAMVLDKVYDSPYWLREGTFKTYQEARKACLEKLIELVEI